MLVQWLCRDRLMLICYSSCQLEQGHNIVIYYQRYVSRKGYANNVMNVQGTMNAKLITFGERELLAQSYRIMEKAIVKCRTINLECLHWFESHLLLVSELGHFRSLPDAPYFRLNYILSLCADNWLRLHFVSLIIIVSVYIITSMCTSKPTI